MFLSLSEWIDHGLCRTTEKDILMIYHQLENNIFIYIYIFVNLNVCSFAKEW